MALQNWAISQSSKTYRCLFFFVVFLTTKLKTSHTTLALLCVRMCVIEREREREKERRNR